MRTIIAFLLVAFCLLILLQATNMTVQGAAGVTNVLAASAGTQPNHAALEVDRDDDSAALLPCTNAPGDCTLRSAITLANENSDSTVITFADHYIIDLAQPLPRLSGAGTIIVAEKGQEVHVNGSGTRGSVFNITASEISISGLRIYGAGDGFANIAVTGNAHTVTIANNLIGDDDAPAGNCGQSELTYAGIYLDATPAPDTTTAWITNNTIECLTSSPGIGILVLTENVVIGTDSQGAQKGNTVRLNKGFGIWLADNGHNVVSNNSLENNQDGSLFVTDFSNDIYANDIR